MLKKIRIAVSAILAVSMCAAAVGCSSKDTDSTASTASVVKADFGADNATYTKGASEVKLSGTFIQSWLFSSWSDERWAQELQMLKDDGMEYIILGDTAIRDQNSRVKSSYYESKLPEMEGATCYSKDGIENALRNCQKYGFKCFVGMYNDGQFFDKFGKDAEWLDDNNQMCAKVAKELYDLYHEKYKDSFYGWYWNPEIWNDASISKTSDTREENIKNLAHGISITQDALTEIDPDMPMMLSSFANVDITSAKDYFYFWQDFIDQAHFRKGDIIAPMDSCGAGGTPVKYLGAWFKAYSQAIAQSGKGIRFWSNCEDFDYTLQVKDDYVCSANWDKFLQQMTTAAKYCEKTITFAYSHYYSPYVTIDGFDKTYKDYLKNGKLETEKPTTPTNLRVEWNKDVATLEWDASTDNIGVSRYMIYRDDEVLDVNKIDVGTTILPTDYLDWDARDIADKNGQVKYSVCAIDCAGNVSDKVDFILK